VTTTKLVPACNSFDRSAWGGVLEVAAREVFDLMLGCHLSRPDHPVQAVTEITAMIGLAGKLCGVMSISCLLQSSVIMASKMLGVDPDKASTEMCDAFGEVCNMVAGNFKNKISGLGDGCMLSVPTVITGDDYTVHPLSDSDSLDLTLLFENSPIFITLKIHS
jgi:chemotaxis protein CheX